MQYPFILRSIPFYFKCWLLFLFCGWIYPQSTIQLQGRVVDESGSPLAGVNVELIGFELPTTTDAQGQYEFNQATGLGREGNDIFVPHLKGSVVHFKIQEGRQQVYLEILDAQGRKLGEKKGDFSPGNYLLDYSYYVQTASNQVLFIRLTFGSSQFSFKSIAGSGSLNSGVSLAPYAQKHLSKTSAAGPDSLHFSLTGYENEVLGVNALNEGVLPDVVLKQGVGFEEFFTGTGRVFNLHTGDTVFIPKEERVHVLLLPDGYTQQDLNMGRYNTDVENWVEDIFALTPYNYYQEAFMVWKVPIPSPNQVGGETYFQIPIDAFSGDMNVTAQKTWELLGRFPFGPKHFSSRRARNFVVQYMILDPNRGRTGFSGRATSLTNPNNSQQQVGIAIALSQDHEFTHAFARVSDEYYDLGHGGMNSTSSTSNLSHSLNCDDLPWKHLILGGEFNPGVDSLVGAFGSRNSGENRFHSEFKCLMNGSHDNAVLFGGSNNLRVDRLCNWCRELVAYRVYYNSIMLRDASTAWDTWVADHRAVHYEHFGFNVPTVVPQQNSEGAPWFQPCTN